MNRKAVRGLFITGTGTGVGKTYVAALVARQIAMAGRRVGVYKPAATGCRPSGDELVSDDALALWQAAGRPGELAEVCPQRFAAPLAPHLAARAEGRRLDETLLRSGLEVWLGRSEIVIVEGVGGLMSPLGEEEYVADLVADFGWPLLVVAANRLGTIHETLATLIVAATFREGLEVAGVVLNQASADQTDLSRETNGSEISRRAVPPVLACVGWQSHSFDPAVDWWSLAVR